MNKKEITISGKQYPVVFTMDTLLNFEKIANKSFFEADFKTILDQIALIASAVITADENTKLTIDCIRGGNDFKALQQIITANKVVSELMGQFFEVPKPIEEAEKREAVELHDGEEDKPKN